jgi:hypothetical protein
MWDCHKKLTGVCLMTLRILTCITLVLFGIVSFASAHTTIYSAALSPQNENPSIPPQDSMGTGNAVVTFDSDLATMRVQTVFSGLTGNVTLAHIHCCIASPGNVGVASITPSFTGFPTGGTSGNYDFTYDMSLAASYNPAFITANGGNVSSAMQALLNGLNSGQAYLNIHTSFRGGGEIRGFLQLVPEPTSVTLALVGLTLPIFTRRFGR